MRILGLYYHLVKYHPGLAKILEASHILNKRKFGQKIVHKSTYLLFNDTKIRVLRGCDRGV